MKKFLLSTVGLLALGLASVSLASAPASAADLAARPVYTKAPPAIVSPYYDWSGFYIGINGGWGQNRDDRANVTNGLALGSHDANGGTVGGQIGYRWQNAGWVFGLEAQGNWADFTGSGVNAVAPGLNNNSKLDAFGLFTGQIGYAWNNVLLYAKGGAAVTDNNYSVTSNATSALLSSTGDNTNWGAVVGAGLEVGFAPNWSVGVEYDHIFMDQQNQTFTTPAGVPLVSTFRTGGDTDLVTARLNYRFGAAGLPKY